MPVAEMTTVVVPTERDVILGEGSDCDEHKMNLFLHDWIYLQCILWKLQKNKPKNASLQAADQHIQQVVRGIMSIVQEGKTYELDGLSSNVPKPFLKGKGRFLQCHFSSAETGAAATCIFTLMEDDQVATLLTNHLHMELQKNLLDGSSPILTGSLYGHVKQMLSRRPPPPASSGANIAVSSVNYPKSCDVTVLVCHSTNSPSTSNSNISSQEENHLQANEQVGSQTLFKNMAAQLIPCFFAASTTTAATSSILASHKRVQMALFMMQMLDQGKVIETDAVDQTKRAQARFLLRHHQAASIWTELDAARAAEFVLTFVFEVYLEKAYSLDGEDDVPNDGSTVDDAMALDHEESNRKRDNDDASPMTAAEMKRKKLVVENIRDNDVLFGYGRFDHSSHLGNRVFRDMIALHRPDYVKSIVQGDKFRVTRKIVQTLCHGTRHGRRPARFLKQEEQDGPWYDFGYAYAIAKTKERLLENWSLAERGQRRAFSCALQIRRQDRIKVIPEKNAGLIPEESSPALPTGTKAVSENVPMPPLHVETGTTLVNTGAPDHADNCPPLPPADATNPETSPIRTAVPRDMLLSPLSDTEPPVPVAV